jgi:starvation-inducible DNA-binding protein
LVFPIFELSKSRNNLKGNIMKNSIGIEKEKAQGLVVKLNQLLADYQLFYQNVRGFHWNIKGKDFFELHLKFEEFYDDAVVKIDEIAERILTLEGEPLHTFSDYLKNTKIEEAKGVTDGTMGVEIVLKNFAVLISQEREILSDAGDADDEGTASLMSDYITETEKTIWMLNSYLK